MRDKTDRATPHIADSGPAGPISPTYRGFRVSVADAGELPAKQRAIDAFWSRAYFEAQTPAGREAVIAQEREWRKRRESGPDPPVRRREEDVIRVRLRGNHQQIVAVGQCLEIQSATFNAPE
jgi:hypothetical protein